MCGKCYEKKDPKLKIHQVQTVSTTVVTNREEDTCSICTTYICGIYIYIYIYIIIQVSSTVVAARLCTPMMAYTASLELFCVIYAIHFCLM